MPLTEPPSAVPPAPLYALGPELEPVLPSAAVLFVVENAGPELAFPPAPALSVTCTRSAFVHSCVRVR